MRAAMPVLVAVAGLAAVLTFGSAAASTLPVDSGQPVRIVLEENASAGGGIDLSLHVLWTVAGAIIGSVIMAYLYLLKRGVGGFPENPEWVAPISIEPSSSFPEEAEQDDHHEPGGHS